MKVLKDLVGEDKTAEDADRPRPEEPKPESEDDPMNGSCVKKGKKRKSEGTEPSPKKLKTVVSSKSALAQLNEMKPGLKYVVESESGPEHCRQFVMSVEVNENKYVGQGYSKQLAKHAAAEAALASFVQFREVIFSNPEAKSAIRKPHENSLFTTDYVKSGEFNNMDTSSTGTAIKSFKMLSEADKNPVKLLNEMHPGVTYSLEEENSSVPSQRFRMIVVVDGVNYEGTGPNKKLAKDSAARSALSNLHKVSYNTLGSSRLSYDAELFNFPQAVADKISKMLISTFNEVMTGNAEHAKWKIIAGIAMTKDEAMEDIQIIGIGTGTKCINGEHICMVGTSLNDCHAEIIARRCLKDFLYTNLELHLEGEEEQSIFRKKEKGGFALKPHIKFHLYISTAPCGDARIFCPHEEGVVESMNHHPNRISRSVLRTKIESGEGTVPMPSDQSIQTWDGILSGQERMLTMSCSDKIASWNVLGLQGALLSYFVEPIYLDNLVLGSLFNPNHLPRALFGRFEETLEDLPSSFKLNKPKMCTLSSPERRHLMKSPNFSVNWTHGLGQAEVVNATTGKTEEGQVSRLSKRDFFQRFIKIYDRLSHIDTFGVPPQPALYATYKGVVKNYQNAKKALTKAFVEAGLGTWAKRPLEQNEFELVS